MHEYVQKSIRTTLPRSCAQRERLRVEPRRDPGEVGCRPVVGEPAHHGCGRLPLGDVRAALERLQAGAARLGVPLEEVGRPGDVRELRVEVEDEREGDRGDQHAEGDAEPLDADAQLRADAPPAEGDREQHDREADRVGDGDQDRLEPEVPRCRRARHVGERRAGARDEDEPERAAEDEAAAEVARGPAREPRERPLDPGAHLGHDQDRGDQEEQADRDVPQQVLRQAELVQDPRREQGRDEEGDREPGDDQERPAPVLAAGDPAGQHDRQHRQHARRDGRDQAGHERKDDCEPHARYSVAAACSVVTGGLASVPGSRRFDVEVPGTDSVRLAVLRPFC